MFPLEQYRQDALSLDLRPFADKYGSHFLVHVVSREEQWVNDADVDSVSPPQSSWAVAIMKRPGNGDPDCISIGRARSCDIVLRYPFISKQHAHMLCKEGRHRLRDLDSSRGSKVNNVPLSGERSVRLEPGDHIMFGDLDIRYVTAAALHAQLRAPAPPASSHAFGV